MAPDTSIPVAFGALTTVEQVREGLALASKLGTGGLIPCITAEVNAKTMPPTLRGKLKGLFLVWKRAKPS